MLMRSTGSKRLRARNAETAETAYLGALCLHELKRDAEAVTGARHGRGTSPCAPRSVRLLGIACDAAGDADGAIAAFERALGLDPDDVHAGARLHLALLRVGRTEQAQQLVAFGAGRTRYLRLWGQVLHLLALGAPREALSAVGAALAVAGRATHRS